MIVENWRIFRHLLATTQFHWRIKRPFKCRQLDLPMEIDIFVALIVIHHNGLVRGLQPLIIFQHVPHHLPVIDKLTRQQMRLMDN